MGFLDRFLSILADILSGPGVLLFDNFNMIFLTSTGEKEIGNLLVSQCSMMSEAWFSISCCIGACVLGF